MGKKDIGTPTQEPVHGRRVVSREKGIRVDTQSSAARESWVVQAHTPLVARWTYVFDAAMVARTDRRPAGRPGVQAETERESSSADPRQLKMQSELGELQPIEASRPRARTPSTRRRICHLRMKFVPHPSPFRQNTGAYDEGARGREQLGFGEHTARTLTAAA